MTHPTKRRGKRVLLAMAVTQTAGMLASAIVICAVAEGINWWLILREYDRR